MGRLKTFAAFVYDFVVGDDWRVAVGVTAGLAGTYLLTHDAGVSAWWLVPALLVTLLPVSLWRAVRRP
jgi:hypothetical protein